MAIRIHAQDAQILYSSEHLGLDSPTLKLSYLSLWLALFQGKTLLEEKTVIVELGESWHRVFLCLVKEFSHTWKNCSNVKHRSYTQLQHG